VLAQQTRRPRRFKALYSVLPHRVDLKVTAAYPLRHEPLKIVRIAVAIDATGDRAIKSPWVCMKIGTLKNSDIANDCRTLDRFGAHT
jgi:hypothetical protein